MLKLSDVQSGHSLSLGDLPDEPVREGEELRCERDEAAARARKHTRAAVATLLYLMHKARKQEVRVRCAEVLLARGWGNPVQAVMASVEVEMVDMTALRAELETGRIGVG